MSHGKFSKFSLQSIHLCFSFGTAELAQQQNSPSAGQVASGVPLLDLEHRGGTSCTLQFIGLDAFGYVVAGIAGIVGVVGAKNESKFEIKFASIKRFLKK